MLDRRVLPLLISTILFSCATPSQPPVVVYRELCSPPEKHITETEQGGRLEVLLANRKNYCAGLRTELYLPAAQESMDTQLKSLLAMSCDPLAYRENIDILLTRLKETGVDTPAANLLDVISGYQESLTEMQKRQYRLQKELDKTIDGIGNIESELNSRDENAGPQR